MGPVRFGQDIINKVLLFQPFRTRSSSTTEFSCGKQHCLLIESACLVPAHCRTRCHTLPWDKKRCFECRFNPSSSVSDVVNRPSNSTMSHFSSSCSEPKVCWELVRPPRCQCLEPSQPKKAGGLFQFRLYLSCTVVWDECNQ